MPATLEQKEGGSVFQTFKRGFAEIENSVVQKWNEALGTIRPQFNSIKERITGNREITVPGETLEFTPETQ